MKEIKCFYSRRFLNKKGYHSTAYIFGEIIKSITKGKLNKKTKKKSKDKIWYDCELKISDCDRIISLSMDAYSKKEYNNSLKKLDILIGFLNKYKESFKEIKK